jgi:hypothetical protein
VTSYVNVAATIGRGAPQSAARKAHQMGSGSNVSGFIDSRAFPKRAISDDDASLGFAESLSYFTINTNPRRSDYDL